MTLVLGSRYRERLESGLRKTGLDTFWLPDNPAVDSRLAGHVDLSILRISDHVLIVAESMYDVLVNYLTIADADSDRFRKYTIVKSSPQGKEYPSDAGLCVCVTGTHTIYNPKVIDPVVTQYLCGQQIVVTQGYTKCSICVVSHEAIITSDPVIASKAVDSGMDVLKIGQGQIVLDGFDHGFIGGASFLLDDKTLAFTGTLENHPDMDRILCFLRKHRIQPLFLSDAPLFDIGGAILV